MTGKIFGPRKQRTRQHVLADLSVHHEKASFFKLATVLTG